MRNTNKEKFNELINKGKKLNPQDTVDKNSAEELEALSKMVDKVTDAFIATISQKTETYTPETKQSYFSTASKEKFSTGNTKVVNLVNSLKDKGIITSELMENEETLGKVQHLVRSIDSNLAKDKDLKGLLNITLDADKYGENIGEGIAKFISSNSPETNAVDFENIINDIITPLSPNGRLTAMSKFNELTSERNAVLDLRKSLTDEFVNKVEKAGEFLNDKNNKIIEKTRKNEVLTPEEARKIKETQDTVSEYKKLVSDISTKHGVTEEHIINNMPRSIKNSFYDYDTKKNKYVASSILLVGPIKF